VKDVFVAGKPVIRDGRLVHVDEVAVLKELRAAAARIAGRLDMNKMLKLRWPVA